MKRTATSLIAITAIALKVSALSVEPIAYGDMNSWISRNIE